MGIKITDIKIFKINRRGALLGYANIVLNDSFIIRGIRLIENRKGVRFVSMPSRKLQGEKKSFRDLCHPLKPRNKRKYNKKKFLMLMII